jgi:hypothetical protein
MTKKIKVFYFSMIGSMVIRLYWMIFREPTGAKLAGKNHPSIDSLAGLAAYTLPFVVYLSIATLVVIIIAAMFKKRWAYIGCFIFGLINVLLILPVVFMRVNPGYGPLFVIPANILMMIFSGLMIKNSK